jgi:hypothetical protein
LLIAEPSKFRLGGSHVNVAAPIPGDDTLGRVVSIVVGALEHAHRLNITAVVSIVAHPPTIGWGQLMMK